MTHQTQRMMDWHGLIRLGLGHLHLHPKAFWALSPIELMVLAGLDAGPATCLRARLDELAQAFPDTLPEQAGGVSDGATHGDQ